MEPQTPEFILANAIAKHEKAIRKVRVESRMYGKAIREAEPEKLKEARKALYKTEVMLRNARALAEHASSAKEYDNEAGLVIRKDRYEEVERLLNQRIDLVKALDKIKLEHSTNRIKTAANKIAEIKEMIASKMEPDASEIAEEMWDSLAEAIAELDSAEKEAAAKPTEKVKQAKDKYEAAIAEEWNAWAEVDKAREMVKAAKNGN